MIRAALLLVLLTGCGSPRHLTGTVTLAPESVKYVQQDADQPYGYLWRGNRVFNLMLAQRGRGLCTYPWQRTFYAVAYRAVVPTLFDYGDTMRGSLCDTSTTNCTVTGGSFWLVEDADTLRGLAVTHRSDLCGDMPDSVALMLVRAGT